jgi:hypothetical protein
MLVRGKRCKGEGVQTSCFRKNHIYGNGQHAISLNTIDGAAGSTHNVITNNSIAHAGAGDVIQFDDRATGNRLSRNKVRYGPGKA